MLSTENTMTDADQPLKAADDAEGPARGGFVSQRHERLRLARADAGYERQRDVFDSFPAWNRNTYKSNENGNAPFSFEQAKVYARAFGVRAEWLYDGAGSAKPDGSASIGLPLIGKVGAGGEGLYDDDYSMGSAADRIEALPGMPTKDIIVLDIDGDSMVPAVFDGDRAFFGPIRHDVDALLNKRVMARLADGRKFFKVLKRGSAAGLYTLRSLNPATPDIEDVEVQWVLPYQGSRPR
jgi:phage repressor protein C with HTH and peptisase S24 domain